MRTYLAGVSLETFARGNRRMLAAVKARRAQRAKQAKKAARKAAEKAQKAGESGFSPAAEPRRTMPVWERAAWSAGGVFLLWPTIGPAVPVTLGTLVAVWVVAALIAGQTDDTDDQAAEVEQAPSDEHQDQAHETPAPVGPTAPEVHHLTARLTAGERSVLLTRLAADLAAAHPSWQGSTKAVRALLSTAGIRVREGVRTAEGNGPGVHHQDAPPIVAAPESAVVANVGPGQSANANANNVEEWTTREGFVMRAHPHDPARTIVVHASDAA